MAFTFYTPFIVNPAKVPASQTDFAALICITDPRFKTVANGGHVQSPNGYDVRPYLDYGLTTTPLSFFLIRYNGATGEVIMRAKVASFTSSQVIYLACGDTTLTTNGSNGAATFSNSFLGVYPFGDGTTLSLADATGTNNATNHGATAAAGQVDGCAAFNGSTQYIDLGSVFNPVALTYAALVKGVAWTNAYNAIIVRVNAGNSIYTMMFVKNNGKLSCWAVGAGAVSADGTGPTTLATGTWYHLAMTYDSVNGLKGYINGVLEFTVAPSGALNATAIQTNIANDTINASRFLNGSMQQVHVSSVARAGSWIAIEANQTVSPTTFWTIGPEYAAGTAPFSVVSVNPACGSTVRPAPQDYAVTFSDPVQVASVAASDFTIGGTPANTVALSAGNTVATFHFNTPPTVLVAGSAMAIAAGAILRNSDGAANMPLNCTLFYSQWVPNLLYVPCQSGVGSVIQVPDAALWGRKFKPQPFVATAITSPELWGNFNFAPAFVGVAYQFQWYCENQNQPVVYSLFSGTLPPGLVLSNVGSTAEGQIAGTPTTQGTYNFTLLANGPTNTGKKDFTIVVGPSPDTGSSGVGGG